MKRNERIAHDLICIIKYGGIGGSVSANEISRLVSHMESTGLVQREVPTIRIPGSNPPAPKAPKPAPPSNPPKITVGLPVVALPAIRLP